MKFPDKHIRIGKIKLHSGGESNIFYDVNGLITDGATLWRDIVSHIDSLEEYYSTYVGIATGGAIIASHFLNFAMIKDGELKGKVNGDYCLIDDVVTTESSLREAIGIIGYKPKKIYVVVDRREKKDLDIYSIYEI